MFFVLFCQFGILKIKGLSSQSHLVLTDEQRIFNMLGEGCFQNIRGKFVRFYLSTSMTISYFVVCCILLSIERFAFTTAITMLHLIHNID